VELNTDTDLGVGVFLPRDIEGDAVEMMPHTDGGDAGEGMRGAAPKAAGGIVGGEREYLVECESLLKFISF